MTTISMTAVHELSLSLLAARDGEWGWYQLARELGRRGHGTINAKDLLIDLAKRGLIETDGDPELAATHYRITEVGRKHLVSLGV